jgi:hypothetical protein
LLSKITGIGQRLAAPINLVIGRAANEKNNGAAANGKRGSHESRTMRQGYVGPNGVVEIESESIPLNHLTQEKKWAPQSPDCRPEKSQFAKRKINASSRNKFIQKTFGQT